MSRHRQEFVVRLVELGLGGRLRIQALCNYLEEAAGRHADLLGCGLGSLQERNITWVLAKLSIHLGTMPSFGQRCILETWPVGVERLFFRRDFALSVEGGAPVATVVSQWLLMNLTSRRLEKMPGWAVDLAARAQTSPQEKVNIVIPALPRTKPGPLFPVRLADIDQNYHVNNIRYLDFILEACQHFWQLPLADFALRELEQLDIIFRAEAVYGDSLLVFSAREAQSDSVLVHSVCRKDSGQELVRARTVWK